MGEVDLWARIYGNIHSGFNIFVVLLKLLLGDEMIQMEVVYLAYLRTREYTR